MHKINSLVAIIRAKINAVRDNAKARRAGVGAARTDGDGQRNPDQHNEEQGVPQVRESSSTLIACNFCMKVQITLHTDPYGDRRNDDDNRADDFIACEYLEGSVYIHQFYCSLDYARPVARDNATSRLRLCQFCASMKTRGT